MLAQIQKDSLVEITFESLGCLYSTESDALWVVCSLHVARLACYVNCKYVMYVLL